MQNSNNIVPAFIILEILIGIIGGILYVNKSDGPPQHSLMDSILNVYLILNAIFFGTTIVIGAISTVFLKKTDRLLMSIILSLAFGVLFLLIHAFALSMAPFVFLSLFGFVFGFNWYLLRKVNAKEEN